MATATNAQKIAGLYAAFFERAPDAAGLSYWETQFTGTATVNDLAKQFAANPVFGQTYGAMTDVQFVNAIYLNVLGAAGDAKGVDYWVTFLKNGGADARSNFVAQFVNDALTVDLSKFTDLTAEELAVAQSRQDTLTNKANVGLYFAEKFGTASNVTTTGDITKDPAYLAAVAAVKGVTADAASVAAAEGRIDVAVGTSDPAGSLVGQNSALTAALVDLQAKTVAEAAALKAVAVADNNADASPITDEAALKAFLDGFTTKAQAVNAVTDAQLNVTSAQAAAATASNNLIIARAATGDDALKADVAAKLSSVNGNAAAKAAYTDVTAAKAAVAAGNDKTILTSLQDSLVAFVKAGGATTTTLNSGSDTVATLQDEINAALAVKDDAATSNVDEAAVALKTLVDKFTVGEYELPTSTPATAAETAVNNAIKAVEARETAYVKVTTTESAFTATPEGSALRASEATEAAREALIKSSTDANTAVTKEQTDLATVKAAFDAYTASETSHDAAAKVVADLGYNIGSLTAGKDLFVGDVAKAGTATNIGTGFASGDELFIGTQFKFGGSADTTTTSTALTDLYAKGSASALEVFFEQTATGTVVHVETKAFANAEAAPVDFATITLTGVTAANLTFENGFVHNAAAATA